MKGCSHDQLGFLIVAQGNIVIAQSSPFIQEIGEAAAIFGNMPCMIGIEFCSCFDCKNIVIGGIIVNDGKNKKGII